MDSPFSSLRTMRGIQQSFVGPMICSKIPLLEAKGVVYTKRWVVDLLLDLAGYTADANLIDSLAIEPAAGEGAFLTRMVERLVDCCERLGRPISHCQKSLIAYELDEASANYARTLVVEVLRARGANPSLAADLAQGWVRCADYLLESVFAEADFVIGNPPYVRLEDIPEEKIVLYRDTYKTMRGRADIYIAFYEAALSQLKENGSCAFICADRWMRNQYGMELRELITSQFAVDAVVEMHDADAFHDEVDAYPAITVLRRSRQGPVIVASAGREAEALPPGKVSSTLLKSFQSSGQLLPAGLRAARVDKWFKGTNPWPCNSPEQLALLRRIEDEFSPLESFAKVGIGVATGHDGVFITKDADLVESSRLLKLALAQDVCKGKMCWSGHYLVDPWDDEGLTTLKIYPRLQSYLEGHKATLMRRHTALKNPNSWYKTIDRVNHSLTFQPKLYIADIKSGFDPVLDDGETYPHHNLYFIQSDTRNLELLGGLLLSSIGRFFIESYGLRMRGGFYRFQAQYLRRIRVPDPRRISQAHSADLVRAFRERDRVLATQTALAVYGIEECEMELALGSR